jgi:tRNA pseudouridine38-40 synthase
MPRYKLTIEYDGTPFAGWQRQPNGPSVQETIENSIEALTGSHSTVHGAGRTDAGVHAFGQVAHVDLERLWGAGILRNALNAHLRPHPVSVLAAEEAGGDFHARFSARRRHYLYRIFARRAPLALERGRAWWLALPLETEAMHVAAQALIGRHDFTTFRAADCQAKSPVKTLDRLDVTQSGDLIEIRAAARSFLHHQVRSMVGSLKLVGEGKWSADDLAGALAAADRSRCGPVAPAHGLYLAKVEY